MFLNASDFPSHEISEAFGSNGKDPSASSNRKHVVARSEPSRAQMRTTQLRPLVPADEPPNLELPVPLNVVGPSGLPFGLP
jgi:hypothetical protein